jgi:hypothetical protein
LRGQNLLNWRLPYITRNLLRHKCLKWVHIIHLSIYNTSYGWKKVRSRSVNLIIDHYKLGITLNYICASDVPHIVGKFLTMLQLWLDFTLIKGLHKKSWASKVARVLILRILKLPILESRENWHLGLVPMDNHKEYYKGEGGWLPPSLGYGESCKFVYAHGLFVHQKCYNYALTNFLFCLWRLIQICGPLVTRSSPHPGVLACPFYP